MQSALTDKIVISLTFFSATASLVFGCTSFIMSSRANWGNPATIEQQRWNECSVITSGISTITLAIAACMGFVVALLSEGYKLRPQPLNAATTLGS